MLLPKSPWDSWAGNCFRPSSVAAVSTDNNDWGSDFEETATPPSRRNTLNNVNIVNVLCMTMSICFVLGIN